MRITPGFPKLPGVPAARRSCAPGLILPLCQPMIVGSSDPATLAPVRSTTPLCSSAASPRSAEPLQSPSRRPRHRGEFVEGEIHGLVLQSAYSLESRVAGYPRI